MYGLIATVRIRSFLSKLKRLLHSINAYRRFLPYTILSAIIKKLFGIVHKKLFNISRIVPSFL